MNPNIQFSFGMVWYCITSIAYTLDNFSDNFHPFLSIPESVDLDFEPGVGQNFSRQNLDLINCFHLFPSLPAPVARKVINRFHCH